MINGDFEKAVSDLNKAINILKNPPEGKDFLFGDKRNFRVKLSEAYIYRGECFFMMNKLTEALNDCNEAIALDSDNPSVYLVRSQIFTKNDLTDNANADKQKYD